MTGAPEPEQGDAICIHCGAEVFWGLPLPEDPCFECGKPVAEQGDVRQGEPPSVEEVQEIFERAASAEQGERCQLCGSPVEVVSSDEGTLSYRPASAEQPNVETQSWRENVERVREALNSTPLPRRDPADTGWKHLEDAEAALDALTTQIEERDKRIASLERRLAQLAIVNDWRARAEKAERALAEMREAVRRHVNPSVSHGRHSHDELRAALSSEDTSDES